MAKRKTLTRSSNDEFDEVIKKLRKDQEEALKRIREKPPVTTYEKKLEEAFIVTPDFLTKVARLIEQQGKQKVLFTVEMSDSSTLENLGLEAVLDLPNERDREMLSITIENEYDSPVRIRVQISSDRYLSGIRYRVVGSDKDASFVSRELESLLQGIVQPFCITFSLGLQTVSNSQQVLFF